MEHQSKFFKNQPSLYRIWDPKRHAFSYTDVGAGKDVLFNDLWTSLWDKDRHPIYENDIVVLHFGGELGWVSGIVSKQGNAGFCIKLTSGKPLILKDFWLQDCYVEGNIYVKPVKSIESVLERLNQGFTQQLNIFDTSRSSHMYMYTSTPVGTSGWLQCGLSAARQ